MAKKRTNWVVAQDKTDGRFLSRVYSQLNPEAYHIFPNTHQFDAVLVLEKIQGGSKCDAAVVLRDATTGNVLHMFASDLVNMIKSGQGSNGQYAGRWGFRAYYSDIGVVPVATPIQPIPSKPE